MSTLPPRPRIARLVLAVLLVLSMGAALAGPSGATSDRRPARADVRVTLDRDSAGGRVISERTACERDRTVALFLRDPSGEGVLDTTQSERSGRYGFAPQRDAGRGVGGGTEVMSVAVGDARCQVAQSGARDVMRAPRPARVRVSLQGTRVRAPHGRVTSTRPGCFREVTVHFFGRSAASDGWRWVDPTTTDEDGRYEFPRGPQARRGQPFEYTTVVLGTGRCAVAQSGVLRIDP